MYYKVYDFICWKRLVFFISVCLLLFSSIVIIMFNFNWGLDFTGGVIIEITVKESVEIATIREIFKSLGFKKFIVQKFGGTQDIIIRLPYDQSNYHLVYQNFKSNILSILNRIDPSCVIKQINWIGPSVSNDLLKKGVIAVLSALISVLAYITVRFEWRLAVGAIISLIHDIVIILGILSFFSIEIDSTIIAALISAIGYSLNDEIVIFDRIRENFYRMPMAKSFDIFNISISQVLSRTIITSFTTAMVLLVLLIFGGSMLYGFSITLLLGVIIGTISSIYIASIFAFMLGNQYTYFKKE